MKGGTPAMENRDTVKNSKWGESKLKLENEYKDLVELIKFEVMIQNTSTKVMLYINI